MDVDSGRDRSQSAYSDGDGDESDGRHRAKPTAESAVSVSDLVKVYGSEETEVRAVDGVTFSIERGTAVGILGPNGAGKTTTIKSILSLVVPTSGSVHVGDVDVHRNPPAAFRRLGAMLEGARNTYWRLTVRENLEFFSVVAGVDYRTQRDRIEALIDQFGLAEKADVPVRELSRGQKQKVALAATMARDVDVLVLDEPTLGLDVESTLALRAELRRLVEDDGITVLLSSHDMDVIQEVCDRVVIMNRGRIVADDSVENLLELFGTQVYEVTVDGPVEPALRRELEATFRGCEAVRRGDATTITVRITGDGFYELVDRLRAANLDVQSFSTLEPDLEEVFLNLTADGDERIDHGVRHPNRDASPSRNDTPQPRLGRDGR